MRDERELDLPMQSIDCMVSQRLIESEDFLDGASQLDSGVGAGFWLYEVCMYVYEKS